MAANWIRAAKGIGIPIPLSEEACGNRVDKWRARIALCDVQLANLDRVVNHGWPPRLLNAGAPKRDKKTIKALHKQRGEVIDRRAAAVEALEALETLL